MAAAQIRYHAQSSEHRHRRPAMPKSPADQPQEKQDAKVVSIRTQLSTDALALAAAGLGPVRQERFAERFREDSLDGCVVAERAHRTYRRENRTHETRWKNQQPHYPVERSRVESDRGQTDQ